MKSTKINMILAAATLVSFAASQASGQILGLYNTGVDDLGQVLPIGTIDPHYQVSGEASVAYVIPLPTTPGGFPWVPAPAGSAWIGPNPNDPWPNDPEGDYHYVLSVTFNLTSAQAASASVSGLWASDNSTQLYLNGADTGFNTDLNEFSTLASFDVTSGFVVGVNNLDFVVNNAEGGFNGGNPSGLLVADMSAQFSPVPEPSTTAMSCLATILAGVIFFRTFKPTKRCV